jgi:hypothetical protein
MSHIASKKSEKPARSRRAQRAHAPPSIVAVELGAPFPSWVANRAFNGEFRLVAQRETEALDSFRGRVLELAQRLFAEGIALDSAIFICNERIDAGALESRRELARGLLKASVAGHEPRVILAAGAHSTPRLRKALQDLAPTLRGQVRIDEELPSTPHSSLASVANVA